MPWQRGGPCQLTAGELGLPAMPGGGRLLTNLFVTHLLASWHWCPIPLLNCSAYWLFDSCNVKALLPNVTASCRRLTCAPCCLLLLGF